MDKFLICSIVVFLILVVIMVIVILAVMKKNFMIKKQLEITNKENEEQRQVMNQMRLEEKLMLDALKNVVKDFSCDIKKFEQLSLNKNNDDMMYLLKGYCNNVDVITNLHSKKCILDKKKYNLKEELEYLVNKLQNDNNIIIKLNIEKSIEKEFIYDNTKLISVLEMIVLKSVENEIKKFKIDITTIQKTRKHTELFISIDNIDLMTNGKTNFDNLLSYLNSKTEISSNLSYFIDNKLLILKENLYYLNTYLNCDIHHFNQSVKYIAKIKIELDNVISNTKLHALIVDDSKQIAQMNKEVLEKIDVESDIVFSGQECLEKLKNNLEDYDIIFTDNQMPNMDGPNLLKELKKIKNFDLPVVIVTADSGLESYFKRSCGFDEYIVKPLNTKQAKNIIKKLIK